MTSHIDKLQKGRQRLMLAVGLAFPLWLVPQLDMVKDMPIMKGLGVLGGFAWIAVMILLVITQSRLSKAGTLGQSILEDELVKANRLKATRNGYIVILGFTALLLLLSNSSTMTARDALLLILIVGVSVPILSFAFFERDDA